MSSKNDQFDVDDAFAGVPIEHRCSSCGRYADDPVACCDVEADRRVEREKTTADDEPGDWCEACGNLGFIECLCGGDLCVCDNNGEIECGACR